MSPEDNRRLTRVGPGTPMGELFRRYWLPVMLSEELPQPDCAPVRVRILCEDLVAFRATDGSIGLLEDACPHRGASLSYGRAEANGLRCIFHGWKFDVAGRCVDMPNVAAADRFQMDARAYPTREVGGAVWAYMGPAAKMPPFREFGWIGLPEGQRGVWKVLQEANFLQGMERDLDTVHTPTHRGLKDDEAARGDSLLQLVLRDYGAARMEVERTAYGLRSVALQPAGDAHQYVRITPFVLPCFLFVWALANSTDFRGFAFVPRDDETTWHFIHLYNAERAINPQYGVTRGLDRIDAQFRKLQNMDNRHMQDRHAMATTSFNGVRGIIVEDHMLAEIQGPLVDRTREHLVPTDAPVVALRTVLMDALDALDRGLDAPAIDERIPFARIAGWDFRTANTSRWQDVRPAENA